MASKVHRAPPMRALASVFTVGLTITVAACSESTPPSPQAGVGVVACPGTAPFVGAPAAPSIDGGASASPTARRWFAVDEVLVGTGSCGWAPYALDLDGRTTDAHAAATSIGSCTRLPGSGSTTLEDGPGGVENNFGARGVGYLEWLDGCFSEQRTDASYTLLLRIDAPDGDALGVNGALYVARDLGHPPHHDASDHWLVDPASLLDGASIERPVVTFSDGYVRGGVFVSGVAGGRATLPLFLGHSGCDARGRWEMDAPIDFPRIVARLDGSAAVLAGALPVAGVRDMLAPLAEALGICPGSGVFEQMTDAFTVAADLVDGAPGLNDPTRPCDALSLGVGLTLVPTGAPGGVAAARAPSPNDCATDAGVDAAAADDASDAGDAG